MPELVDSIVNIAILLIVVWLAVTERRKWKQWRDNIKKSLDYMDRHYREKLADLDVRVLDLEHDQASERKDDG